MFNLGISEIAVIAILALILIGPKQLPEVARVIGRLLNELRRSTSSLKEEFQNQVQFDHQKIFDLNRKDDDERKKRELAQQESIKRQEEEMSGHGPESAPPIPAKTTDDNKS
ncbi:MAG: Sec-independent protein translocase subunit TatA/TatB [Pseudobdellovibrionaceae bacterium]